MFAGSAELWWANGLCATLNILIVYTRLEKDLYLSTHVTLSLTVTILIYQALFLAGDMFELGVESGRYYSLNVPLRDGIDDQGWSFVGTADWIFHIHLSLLNFFFSQT